MALEFLRYRLYYYRLLYYIRNKRDPNTEPWGTPALIFNSDDEEDLHFTFCSLSLKLSLNQL